MTKKKYYNFGGFKISQTLLAAILIVGTLIILAQKGYLGGQTVINWQGQSVIDTSTLGKLNNPTDTLGTVCSISFNPSTITIGESTTGTIRDGINAQCSIFAKYNNGAWQFMGNVLTDSKGIFSQKVTPPSAGDYRFSAICSGCITSPFLLKVNPIPAAPPPPDTDGDGIPDSIDNDDDNDGWTDDQENEAGTDSLDPTDHPHEEPDPTYTCGADWDTFCEGTCPSSHPLCETIGFPEGEACACMTDDGTDIIHSDWKPGGIYYNPKDEPEPYDEPPIDETVSYNCYDSDAHLSLTEAMITKGYCEDDLGKNWDYCDAEYVTSVVDWYCINDGGYSYCSDSTSRNCAAFIGPDSTCNDGACTLTQPLSNPPGIGWGDYRGVTGSWYAVDGYPDYWYPFHLNLGTKIVAIEYWVTHYPSGNFVDTTNPVIIRGVNAGNIVCHNYIYTDADSHGIMTCSGTSTSDWRIEINNQKIEPVNWKIGWYNWNAP